MKTVLPVLIFLSLSLLTAETALACVCVSEPRKYEEIRAGIAKEFNESAAVFSGEVVAQDTFKVRFKLIAMWKGDAFEEFTMSTGAEKLSEGSYRASSCDYQFEVGKKYLVYARSTEDNELVARKCTRTNILDNAARDLPELDILNPSAYRAPSSASVSRLLLPWRNLTSACSRLG